MVKKWKKNKNKTKKKKTRKIVNKNPYLAEGINLLCRPSLWCVPLRKRPIYTSKSDWLIPLLWAKFELECLLIKFNECWYIEISFRRKKSKIYTISVTILLFSHQNSVKKLPSWIDLSLLLVIKPSNAFQNGSF